MKAPAQPADGGKIRVLIVDDIPETRENLKKLLAFETDIDVVGTASTGREGLEMTQQLRPDIVLMDINMPDMDGIQATDAISKAVPSAQVVMMSVQSEADYLRRAMLAGARDFLTKPISGEELVNTIRSVYARRPLISDMPMSTGSPSSKRRLSEGEKSAQIIVVYSPQGGAGKTTIATNVAAALMGQDTKVLLVDCDVQFGDVAAFLNLQAQNTLLDLVHSVDDLDMDLVDNVLVSHDSGLKALLAPRSLEDAEQVTAEATVMLVDKLRGMFDFIVVDTSSALNELNLGLFDKAARILLVANPTLPAVKNMRTILNVFDQLGYPQEKTMLVFNRVSPDMERAKISLAVQAIENHLKRKSVAVIPVDERRVLAAINRGVTVIAKERTQSPAKELVQLAETVRNSVMPETAAAATGPAKDAKQATRFSRFLGGGH